MNEQNDPLSPVHPFVPNFQDADRKMPHVAPLRRFLMIIAILGRGSVNFDMHCCELLCRVFAEEPTTTLAYLSPRDQIDNDTATYLPGVLPLPMSLRGDDGKMITELHFRRYGQRYEDVSLQDVCSKISVIRMRPKNFG
jgi:hypothetical protein